MRVLKLIFLSNRHYRKLKIVGIGLMLPLLGEAFNENGFYSGMSREQVIAAVQRFGFTLGEIEGTLVNRETLEMFNFCGNGLISYLRNINFDADYIPALQTLIEKNGQPEIVRVIQSPWSGPGGGYVQGVEMLWYRGKDRIRLSFSPKAWDGYGKLRHNGGASIEYRKKNNCWQSEW